LVYEDLDLLLDHLWFRLEHCDVAHHIGQQLVELVLLLCLHHLYDMGLDYEGALLGDLLLLVLLLLRRFGACFLHNLLRNQIRANRC